MNRSASPWDHSLLQRWDRLQSAILVGKSFYHPFHLHQVQLFEEGYRVYNIDCAIRFNALTIAEEARNRGLSEEEVLSSIYIQRAFTPYQILDSIQSILHTRHHHRTVYALLAPAKQFFDGDVKKEEAAFLLERLTKELKKFQEWGIPLVIVEYESYPSPLFEPFLRKLFSFFEFRMATPFGAHLLPQSSSMRSQDYGKNPSTLLRSNFNDRGAVS